MPAALSSYFRPPLRLLPLFVLLLLPLGAAAQRNAYITDHDRFYPVEASHGMVASQDAIATRVGVKILEQGGNAVDAAVAVAFTLAVTLPDAGNVGGGGFMLVHEAKSGKTVAIDYRETAPGASTRDMYIGPDGKVDRQKKRYSYYSIGVPGTVAGLALAQQKYGTLPLARVMAPAIRLAEEGFTVDGWLADALARTRDRLARSKAAAAIFLHADGSPLAKGERLVQKDLAWSLRQIAEYGPDAFYRGAIAQKIVAQMKEHGGPITPDDLAGYHAVVRRPVHGTYHGYDIYSMPPPSSGGVHLVQMLNLLEPFPIGFLGADSAETIHLMAESMKLAYADRSKYLGDPDFVKVPVEGLTSKAYANALRPKIDLYRATPSKLIAPGNPLAFQSTDTTHFSVMDEAGNMVSNTYTLNFGFGTGIVAAGTGILLNDEMDDFTGKVGAQNAYGLVGGEANAVAPGKRPLSSMTPTLVLEGGKPYIATGSPGGSHIITTVLQIVMNVIDHHMNIAAATAAPRVHHQWLPDVLRVEKGLSPDTLGLLRRMGYKVEEEDAMGSTQSILRTADGFYGAADPRSPGDLAAGY